MESCKEKEKAAEQNPKRYPWCCETKYKQKMDGYEFVGDYVLRSGCREQTRREKEITKKREKQRGR